MSLDARKLAAGRLWATNRFPYLATALFAMQVTASDTGGQASVDSGWRLAIDPALVDSWSVPQLGALLVHHSGHLVRDHAGRARSLAVVEATADRWRLAADAELNDDLDAAGITPPGPSVPLPEHFGFPRGRLAEEYFCRLGDHELPEQVPCCGGGADGQDDGERPAGLSEHEASLLRAQTASEIVKHAAENRGDVPEGWRRWAEDLLEPRVPWRRVLAAELRRGVSATAGRVDYSYRWPSRRSTAVRDVVLPALEQPVPEVAVVCDTSGSMSRDDMTVVLSEVEGLLSSAGLRGRGVRVLAVDADVHAVRRVSTSSQVVLAGGGGTDMARGIEAATALRPRPNVVVVITDGLTPWPAEAPRGTRVIVALVKRPGPAGPPPAWARVVEIDGLDGSGAGNGGLGALV